MFVASYSWEVHPGKEEQFRAAWRRGTELIRKIYGSYGSRLHRESRDDDRIIYVGVAEWPDRETWQRAFDLKMDYDEPATRLSFVDAIHEYSPGPLLLMDLTDDLVERLQICG
jgi:heme-degrading monooxygenase HmoA